MRWTSLWLLSGVLVAQAVEPASPRADLPLPSIAASGGLFFHDLNGDGYDDLIVSNPSAYGVFLFVPKERERKNLQWDEGWSQVLREGKAGDANSLPLILHADGSRAEVVATDKALSITGADGALVALTFDQLLKVPGPAPKSPQDSLRSWHLKPGFTASLVAAEPLVQDPVFVDWDAQGRMWVVEMGDYPFAPGEKTKDGLVGQDKVSDLQTGRVKILEDSDGDGLYDKATLFLEGLRHPTGLASWKNGVFIANIPDIFYAEDTDGDGKCDKRETWFTGFTAGNPQHLVNGFCWGLDGWFYGANGDSGGDIECVKTGQKIALGTNDFRFNPMTGVFEIEAGRTQYGRWRDDWGNWFGNNNSILGWNYWLPLRDLARNPDLAVRSTREVINNDKRIFPVSQQLRRYNNASAINTLTSGCNAMPFRDVTFGAAATNALFICEPANNLVTRQVLDYRTMPITSHRHAEDADNDFLSSEDNWTRPTMARTGPDGALYVVDMYRLVLEHPEWIPAEIAHGLDLRAGQDKGRIYRIAPKDLAAGPAKVDADLIASMQSTNGWRRDMAQRLILEKGDTALVPELARVVENTAQPAAVRLQAAWTLRGLNKLSDESLRLLLSDAHPHLRAQAVELARSRPDLAPTLVGLLADDHPVVQRALALAAGDVVEPHRTALVAGLMNQPNLSQPLVIATLTSAKAALAALTPEERKSWQQRAKAAPAASAPAMPIITNQNPDRQKIVAQYAGVAGLQGDAVKGKMLYQAICIACHTVKGAGNELGPDLGTVAAKPTEQIVEAILDPNRAVELRYTTQTLKLKDGRVFVGLVTDENTNNLSLRTGAGLELILLKDIAERKNSNTSLMPDGLEALLKPQDIADIIAWIRQP
ncbi:MAG: c-type cytochrome [Verrucomicrobiaceae bacterium]|nr:c-type cytochrome [Verrucomicrobiaceae bacterium]